MEQNKKSMYERMAPPLKSRVIYDFKHFRPKYRTELPGIYKSYCTFGSDNRLFEIVIDKKKEIIIVNSNVCYKRKSYPTEKEKFHNGLFEIHDVAYVMYLYLNVWSLIEKCLSWNNPVVYLFALLDRRIGKKTVKKIYEDRFTKPEWIQRFICPRANAEGIGKGETEYI